nr:class I SAM-dependent methyltransferase [uncultured Rhodopila sp.]
MTHTSNRLNGLAKRLDCRTYLEIGVCEGDTFRLVEIPEKTGVDPNFRFDPDTVRDGTTQLIGETSDCYFALLPVSTKFDAVFIDGLHTFEQVVRDFSNAIIHTHDRSVILLDDTRPSDVYSSLPDAGDASRFRRQAGGESADWHGDVFKAVFYINDFWPSLNYRTFYSGGNPQTLVWRSLSERHAPLFNSLELISRLSFFDLHRNIGVLRAASEEDAISLCVSEILI